MKLIVGDIIEGEIIDLGINGEGVVKIDAYPVFVPFALPHEKIRAKVSFAKKDCAFADLIEVLTPSNERVKPVCCYFAKCGGCDLQHMSKNLQLEIKRESVERTIRRNAGIDVDVLPVVSLNEYAYRNKLSLPFGVNGEGKIILGFYAKRTHKVVSMKHCPLHGEWAADLISVVTAWANDYGISAYSEGTGKGLLRHLVARKLDTLSVAVVINGFSLPHTVELFNSLEDKFGKVTLYVSSNTKNTNVIMGDNLKLVGGKEYEQNIGGFNAKVSLLSFFQVNNAVRDAIYKCVADNLDGEVDELVELYSGVGLLTAELAMRMPHTKITSVEIVSDAVDDAKALMKKLNLSHRVKCLNADAGAFMKEYNCAENSAIILDPPRKGCDEEVINAIANSNYKKVVYVSCNPATLARDLKTLLKSYKIKFVQPYDMFPQTANVETLVQLSHKTPDSHIVVKVDFDKDNSAQTDTLLKNAEPYKPAERVTYKMIQAYVEEKYGFKVHTAYIAEVKHSYGLPMYDAPNAVEELKRPCQHPSEKMVEAIKDALKHFDIV